MRRRGFLRSLMASAALIVVAPASALAEVHRTVPLGGLSRFPGRYIETPEALYAGAAGGGKTAITYKQFDFNITTDAIRRSYQDAVRRTYQDPLEHSLLHEDLLAGLSLRA